jgi:hypothetical protein
MLLSLGLVSLLLAGPYQEPRDTLIARAKDLGGRAETSLDIEIPVSRVDALTREAPIILRGMVRAVKTALSNDQRFILTEYEILPTHFYKGSLVTATRPGQSPPLVVTHLGGTLEIDGLHLATVVDVYPAEERLRPGEDVILFLTPNEAEPGCFRLTGGPFGAFRVKDGTVTGLTSEVRTRRADRPEKLTDFEGRLAGHAK